MAEVASAYVSLMPSAKGFGSKLQSEVGGEVNSAGKKLGSGFGKMFALGGGLIAAAGIGSFLKGSLDEAREAQKVGALTENAIRATGGAANVTAKQVGDLASSFSTITGVDDEVIQSGANLLLTFKNVRNEAGLANNVFDRATRAAVDLSAAGFGSVEGASKMLGKALNDPVKGITALGRAGVTFSDGQKKSIEKMVENNNLLGAQKVILGELNGQVGGAAAATATYGEKAAVAFGNIKEQVGTALLPVVDGFFKLFLSAVPTVTNLINGIGPAFSRVGAFLGPLVAQIKSAFSAGGAGSGLQSFAASIQSTVLPVLKTMATTFATVILPAVTSVVSYVASALVPVFSQVAGIITGKVLPILATLYQFFYGKVIPAVVQVAQSVGAKLKPVFDQLVATFRGQVLPTVAKVLGKFREWQPTLQKVVLVVVKVAGAILTLAAAILGKVLPVVIRFAGFLISKIVPAVAAVIGVLVKIVASFFETGKQVVAAGQAFGRFSQVVDSKIRAALGFVAAVPGKVLGYFANANTLLLNAGRQLMTGLASGIQEKITDAINAVKAGLDRIKGLLPGSPIKWGPLKGWNNGGAGKRLMDLVTLGITKGTPKTIKAAEEAFGKIGDALKSERDTLAGILDGLKSDFASLADSVAKSFTGDLFGVTATEAVAASKGVAAVAGKTVGENFISNLMAKRGELTGLLSSFTTLKGWGLDPAFLSQLFASGNGALITELAGMGQTGALNAGALFSDVSSLGATLGGAVATNDPVTSRIDETNRQLERVVAQLGFLGSDIGKELNGVAAKAQRDKKNKKGKGGK